MIISASLSSSPVMAGEEVANTFKYTVDRFANVEILRYKVPGFEALSLDQKKLVYYLSEAAHAGRDILFDQNCRWNLTVRRTLEAIYKNSSGDKNSAEFIALTEYLKEVWYNNGIHQDYSSDKLKPRFSQDFFVSQVKKLSEKQLHLDKEQTKEGLLKKIVPVIFDPAVLPKRANQAEGEDLLKTSANNYYAGVTQAEAEDFYNKLKDTNDLTPVSLGLNSRLVKENGRILEKIWKVGGLYSLAIEKIIYWLNNALPYTENAEQKAVIERLISYYKSGSLKEFDEYAILWLKDLNSDVDFVNGFTESYGDPLGLKASWEAIVNFKNREATKRTESISDNAQWFEDHSPIDARFKKETVKGVSAKVITVAALGGDCYPSTPIGINLPNSNWIRRDHGSKSVTIENITEAYDKASQGNGFLEEFVWDDENRERIKKYGFQADNLHTDLHECLGHGSGKLLPGVDPDALKAYGSPMEEARADLFALYYIADPRTVELGLLPDAEAYKAEYYRYVMNGILTQLIRVQPGKNIEQAHMRNRALIGSWLLEKGADDKVIELKQRDAKTFVVINDFRKMRELIGKLLAEVQRIKSEGDYEAARQMIEAYAVKVNPELHKEILSRYEKLNIAPFKGFVNPVLFPMKNVQGEITDIRVSYDEGYVEQMLRYSKEYSTLPNIND
ncbi:dipeptidyl-peptidase 3 family protein [Parabacteroides sp. FAFU027]|uniref:dipeptidyl-peptidase 3 family protein n=1 Tax=Parabacteroides sp. FAFU027 TaxID=2922715 RepID=UPI00397CFFFC